MKISWKNELIGSIVEILSSKNKTLVGIKGKVIEETKNTLTIKGEKVKKIIKSHAVLKINAKIIEGKFLIGRPEDRIRK